MLVQQSQIHSTLQSNNCKSQRSLSVLFSSFSIVFYTIDECWSICKTMLFLQSTWILLTQSRQKWYILYTVGVHCCHVPLGMTKTPSYDCKDILCYYPSLLSIIMNSSSDDTEKDCDFCMSLFYFWHIHIHAHTHTHTVHTW